MDMLLTLFLLSSFSIWLFILYMIKNNAKLQKSPKLPPGPKPFPIIGNILELGQKPHHSLTKLSKIYGPLIHLKLGKITTIVVSSPEIAKTILQKHDQIFSNRPTPDSIRPLDHHKFSIAWMSADNQWRKLRKLCKEHMFSVSKLDASQGLRMEKLRKLYDYVNECCDKGESVDIGQAAFTMSLSLISSTLFSVDMASSFGSDSSQELKELVWAMLELVGKPNFGDYFPILQFFDPQGVFRKNKFYFKKCFGIFDKIIYERMQARNRYGSMLKNDLLEGLLDVNQKNESELSFDGINHLLLDLFAAGTDTSSSTVEWAMTELLRNPEKMSKAKEDLNTTIGKQNDMQETDITRLPYLRAVIKETLRLHPPTPLSLPHKSEDDFEIDGYKIPKNAQILVNIYALGRDSKLWSDPERFVPERFLERDIDFRGHHFELIPFGAGRRICPGIPLADRMVHLMVATLIHKFDWRVDEGKIDMDEKFGLTLQKATPLMAVPCRL